jgi:hypothetical protein
VTTDPVGAGVHQQSKSLAPPYMEQNIRLL